MSELDISPLLRLLNGCPESPENRLVASIIEAADSDGVANEEDRVLTATEARGFLERLRGQTRDLRNLFNRHRSHLPGPLAEAQARVLQEDSTGIFQANLARAASVDGRNEDLSQQELRLLEQELRQGEEAFLSVRTEDFRTFPEPAMPEGVLGLLRLGGMDPASRDQDWTIPFDRAEELFRSPLFREERECVGDPERWWPYLRRLLYGFRLEAQENLERNLPGTILQGEINLLPLIRHLPISTIHESGN